MGSAGAFLFTFPLHWGFTLAVVLRAWLPVHLSMLPSQASVPSGVPMSHWLSYSVLPQALASTGSYLLVFIVFSEGGDEYGIPLFGPLGQHF